MKNGSMGVFAIIVAIGLLAAAAAKLGTAAPPTADELDRIILRLGDDDGAMRVQARQQLEKIGEPAIESLKQAAASSDDPEVRTEAKALLAKFAEKASGLIHMYRGSNPGVTAIAISGDGRIGVSAHDDWAIRIWNLEQNTLHRQIAKHVTAVLSVAISPDGRRILSGSAARMIRLWDAQTGAEIRNFVAPAERIYSVAFSPDGKSFLSGWGDGNARLFDIETGKIKQTHKTGDDGIVWAIAFTPDGKYAVTGGGGSEDPNASMPGAALQLWDVSTGQTVRQFHGLTASVRRAAISPDGKQLLTASTDGVVRLWDLSTGKELQKIEGPRVVSATLTPDGKRAIASYDSEGGATPENDLRYTLKLWDLVNGRDIRVFKGHRGPITCFAISGNGRRLFSGCADGTMGLWEVPN